jgi:hypothetical protein
MQKTGQFLFLFERELDDYLGVKCFTPPLVVSTVPNDVPYLLPHVSHTCVA